MSGITYVRGDATVPSVKGVKLIVHRLIFAGNPGLQAGRECDP
ncbi:hypothetical protein BX281_2441 [Streptomyces sp. Ag82_O1-15]|nr:hypothetical protein BX281_2441 [Streptomyces sp. Ag82_O1-15]